MLQCREAIAGFILAQELLEKTSEGITVASYRPNVDRRNTDGIPSLEEVESGKLLGAILPMSEQAQTQLRDSIEVIDYLMNQESVVWS